MSNTEVWPNGMPAVGQKASRSRKVRSRDIEFFTEISGDRNPLHYDRKLAEATRFGEIVVQGGVTSAILNAVVAEDLPGPGTVFLQVNWNFRAPVRPGDTLRVKAEVVSSTSSASRGDRGRTGIMYRVLNQADEVVMTYQIVHILKRVPIADSG